MVQHSWLNYSNLLMVACRVPGNIQHLLHMDSQLQNKTMDLSLNCFKSICLLDRAAGTLCFRLRMPLSMCFKVRVDPSLPIFFFCCLCTTVTRVSSGCRNQASKDHLPVRQTRYHCASPTWLLSVKLIDILPHSNIDIKCSLL